VLRGDYNNDGWNDLFVSYYARMRSSATMATGRLLT